MMAEAYCSNRLISGCQGCWGQATKEIWFALYWIRYTAGKDCLTDLQLTVTDHCGIMPVAVYDHCNIRYRRSHALTLLPSS